jgi:hypothetical protein
MSVRERSPGLPPATDEGVRDAIRDARLEGAAAMLVADALLIFSSVLSRAEGWRQPGTPWWAWLLFAIPETVLLAGLLLSAFAGVRPGRERNAFVVLLVLLAVGSLTATGFLIAGLVTADLTAGQLLVHAFVVWSTNLVVFGLLFWELDEGGPVQRVLRGRRTPDFLFPQDQNPHHSPAGWRPRLLDFMYVSLTNSLAFSPTDAMPLTRRAKSLMALESFISNAVVVLVIARAVNVLG